MTQNVLVVTSRELGVKANAVGDTLPMSVVAPYARGLVLEREAGYTTDDAEECLETALVAEDKHKKLMNS